jgi:beta-lactamase class A
MNMCKLYNNYLKLLCFSAICIISFSSYAEKPYDNQDWLLLHKHVDKELQKQLEYQVKNDSALRNLAKNKKFAIGVVDLSGNNPRFAAINANKMMYAASLPKIAILLASYESFEDGTLEESNEVHEDLAAMIRVSSNVAATRMIDRIGMNKINNILKNPKYKLYDTEQGGGLWVGKRYAKKGARRPDPLNGISHCATVAQICRFYYLLSEKRLVSPKRSDQMLSDLSNPGLHHKFVHSLNLLAPKATIYRKSGTWQNYHADSVLVNDGQWRNYILTAMVESSNGEAILKTLVPLTERALTFNDFHHKG